jgi:hypothetical protein
MHTTDLIRPVGEIIHSQKIILPEKPGVYAFWWIGSKDQLMQANRHIVLKGPKGLLVNVEYKDWWPTELIYPCLYVGKSTNIKKRFSLHIKSGSKGRLHEAHDENHKVRPCTTSCQLRFGIEHVFPTETNPLDLILNYVGFSYQNISGDNAIADRFFMEDLLVGKWRPWFNIDSER